MEQKKESKLSSLYAQQRKLTDKLTSLFKRKKEINKEIDETRSKLAGVENGLNKLNERPILLSSHFIERYNERVKPGTEEEIRQQVITPQLVNMINTLGNGSYPVGEYTVIVEDRKLITILAEETPQQKNQRKKKYGK